MALNFKKMGLVSASKKTNPIEIYDTLDRESDKGPLRAAQEAVLNKWCNEKKQDKDVILKLHTGQGKTLVGLLILQAKLNEGQFPVLYLCPNKFLVKQTCEQAKQFGIKFCVVDKNNTLPQDFLNGKSILITHVQMLFNGLTKFGTRHNSLPVDSIVLDDSHACISTIDDAFTIKIKKDNKLFGELINLFERDLESQGAVRLEEIKSGEYDSFLPVPYWAWQEKISDVISLLVKSKEQQDLLFQWPLLKDILQDCQCIISGWGLEISPYFNPLDQFGSFAKAKHRVFMSATTSNDSFFIRDLGLSLDTVTAPITYNKEKWAGEKMILIPYLMFEDLRTVEIVNLFGKPNVNRKFGVVALTPSKREASYWEELGALKGDSSNIDSLIQLLKDGKFEKTVVLSNRYDGIDLPDDLCRILILHGKPTGNSLKDRYQETCRADSKIVDVKTAQKIEQGLGRGVRGEKDRCVVIITGPDLIQIMRTNRLKGFFSAQTNKQIEIGLQLSHSAVQQSETDDGYKVLAELIGSSVNRNEDWKEFYVQNMNELEDKAEDDSVLQILRLEKEAEHFFSIDRFDDAVNRIQNIINDYVDKNNFNERGWYTQEKARYYFRKSKTESTKIQIAAWRTNRFLLKPTEGIEFKKLEINQSRNENIRQWLLKLEKFEELKIAVDDILTRLAFGVNFEKFEDALDKLGKALGYATERPDKEQKQGPDNLWNIKTGEYILFECKNEVKENRDDITKKETSQFNTNCTWFKNNYNLDPVKNIIIIPTKTVAADAGFSYDVDVMRRDSLNLLVRNVRKFFNEFADTDLKTISETQIEAFLQTHRLTNKDLLSNYTEKPFQKKI